MDNIPYLNGFPSPLVPKSEKLKDSYGLAYGKMIEGQWWGNNNQYYNDRKYRFQENRAYAKGKQDVARYKQRFNATGSQSLYNLDWSPIPVVRKFVKIIVNNILEKDYRINARAIDVMAESEKEKMRQKLLGVLRNQDFIDEVKNRTGIDMAEGMPMLQSIDEIDMYMQTTFRESVEIALQLLIKFVFDDCGFSDEIRKRIIEDLVVCGIAGARVTTDPHEGIKIRYIDPVMLLTGYATEPDFSDTAYAAEMRVMTISDIKAMCGDKFSDKDYEKMARQHVGWNGNPQDWDTNSNNYRYVMGQTGYWYDSFKIPVIDFEFMSVDALNFERKENKYGKTYTHRKGENYTPPKESKYKREKATAYFKTVYHGMKVKGCDYMLQYGMAFNQVRPKNKIGETFLSFKIYSPGLYQMIPDSLVDGMKVAADMIQVTHLRMLNAIAQAAPDGYTVNVDALTGVILGKGAENWGPLQLQDFHKATGILYHKTIGEGDERIAPPVQPLPSMLSSLNPLIATYNHYMNQLRDVSGVVPELEGRTKSEQGLGVTQLAIDASNNSIKDIELATKSIVKRCAIDVALRIQDIPKNSTLFDYYKSALGNANMAIVESMDGLPPRNFGITFEFRNMRQDITYLEDNIRISLTAGEIRIEDASWARRLAQSDPELADAYLMQRRRVYQKEKAAADAQNIQLQAQVNQENAMVAAQAEMQKLELQTQLEVMKEAELTKMKNDTLMLEYQLKMEQDRLNALYKVGVDQGEKAFRMQIEEYKEDRKDERTEKQATQQSELIEQRQKETGAKDFTEPKIPDFLKKSFLTTNQ